MKKRLASLSIDELRAMYSERRNAIRQRLKEFSSIPDSEYFYELVYCVLTPQSSAVNAEKAVQALRDRKFFETNIDPEPLLHQKEFYIRFHKTKAKHLIGIKQQYEIIHHHLTNGGASAELRQWLVQHVKGLGWKEASHLLRNIGHRDLAILDRHILRNLLRTQTIRQLPQTLTAKQYHAIEKKFRAFSDRIKIPMDELDLLFWSMETGKILK